MCGCRDEPLCVFIGVYLPNNLGVTHVATYIVSVDVELNPNTSCTSSVWTSKFTFQTWAHCVCECRNEPPEYVCGCRDEPPTHPAHCLLGYRSSLSKQLVHSVCRCRNESPIHPMWLQEFTLQTPRAYIYIDIACVDVEMNPSTSCLVTGVHPPNTAWCI